MIVFFVGTPGSGKSYEAVKKIVDNLKMGRVVCTNIDGMDNPQCQEYIKSSLDMSDSDFARQFVYLTPEQVVKFWERDPVTINPGTEFELTRQELICPLGSMIVIDEAHKFFNSHDWRKTENRKLADWASTHRHEGYDLVLITQDVEKVDKQVRTLAEWTYFFRKVNFLGSVVSKKYLCYSYAGNDHRGNPLSKNVRTYQQAIFNCYRSYSHADAKEVGFMSHINVFKHPVFFAIPIVLAFCVYMLSKSSFASGDLFGTKKRLTQAAPLAKTNISTPSSNPAFANQTSSGNKQPASPLGVAVASPAAPPPVFTTYPLDGYINDNGRYLITFNGATVRLPHPDIPSWSKTTFTVIGKTDIFGTIKPRKPQSSSSQPVVAQAEQQQTKPYEPLFLTTTKTISADSSAVRTLPESPDPILRGVSMTGRAVQVVAP